MKFEDLTPACAGHRSLVKRSPSLTLRVTFVPTPRLLRRQLLPIRLSLLRERFHLGVAVVEQLLQQRPDVRSRVSADHSRTQQAFL